MNIMEECPRCQSIDNKVIEQRFANGTTHRRCSCDACGMFIRYLPQEEPTLHFGRFKRQSLASIPADYLQWVVDRVRITARVRQCIEQELQSRQVNQRGPR